MNYIKKVYEIFEQHLAPLGITPKDIYTAINSLGQAQNQVTKATRKRLGYTYTFTLVPAGATLGDYESNIVWRYYPNADYQIVFLAFDEDYVSYTSTFLWGISQNSPSWRQRFERWIGRKLESNSSRTGEQLTAGQLRCWLIEIHDWNETYGLAIRMKQWLEKHSVSHVLISQLLDNLCAMPQRLASRWAPNTLGPAIEAEAFVVIPSQSVPAMGPMVATDTGDIPLFMASIVIPGTNLVLLPLSAYLPFSYADSSPVVPIESWNQFTQKNLVL